MADEDPTYQEIVEAKCNGSSFNHLPINNPSCAFRNVWEFISVEEGFGSPSSSMMAVTFLCHPQHAPTSLTSSTSFIHAGQVKTNKAAQQLYY